MKTLSPFRALTLLLALAPLSPAAAAVKRRPAPVAESTTTAPGGAAGAAAGAQAANTDPSAQAENGGGASRSNGIAAVVNGRPILKSELDEKITMQEMQLRATIGNRAELNKELTDLRRKTLDSLVEQELILKEFEPFAAGFGDKITSLTDEHIRTRIIKEAYKGNRTELLRALSAQGLSYKRFYEIQRNQVIVSVMRGQNTRNVGYVTSEEKDAYLAAHDDDFREDSQIKLWSITIPMVGEEIGATPAAQQALVKDIRAKLLRGDSFATLAKMYSRDSKSGDGGDWGFITKKDFTRYLSEMVFAMPVKKVSDVIEFDGSYYIFYVEAKNPGKMPPREKLEPILEQRVLMEKQKKAYDTWIESLKRKATIRYYDR